MRENGQRFVERGQEEAERFPDPAAADRHHTTTLGRLPVGIGSDGPIFIACSLDALRDFVFATEPEPEAEETAWLGRERSGFGGESEEEGMEEEEEVAGLDSRRKVARRWVPGLLVIALPRRPPSEAAATSVEVVGDDPPEVLEEKAIGGGSTVWRVLRRELLWGEDPPS